jgi:hypothetical protein
MPSNPSLNSTEDGFETPEEAALSGYPTEAHARVVRMKRRGKNAVVEVETDPSYRYFVHCREEDGLGYNEYDHN